MRKEKHLRTLRIDEKLHAVIKAHCEKNGIKIYKWVENTLREKITRENIN
jgi:predicted HicB family RNase H-like nuclease